MSFRIGSKGEEVRKIQSQLIKEGIALATVDGIFGAKTRKAVIVFQEAKGLEVDGVVGPATIKALGINIKVAKLEKERGQFSALLAMNPNYFGNLKVSEFEPVKSMKANVSYEELMCVGFHPHLDQLEAVVYVKKTYGYSGGICSNGSMEYVRFYVDWKNDGHWSDVGMTAFRAYDVPGVKPLEYAVVLPINPRKSPCTKENLPKVRAILSWQTPPPADAPDHEPVWGNAKDGRIQIDKRKKFTLQDLHDLEKLKIPKALVEILDLQQEISVMPSKALLPRELHDVYKNKGVPVHRYIYPQLNLVTKKPALGAPDSVYANIDLGDVNINLSDAVGDLLKLSENTDYEELNCIGYDTVKKALVGTLTIKRPYGYLGDLCKKGSQEYVAFWEWDEDESDWVHLGTSSITAHDITGITKEGLKYAVYLPVNFSHRRKLCAKGASIVRIRAILSWSTQPPASNPYYRPKWGNRKHTHIHILPGKPSDDPLPLLDTVGDMDVCDIDQSTGLATGTGIITSNGVANESPFGGTVTITGIIANAPAGVMEGTESPLKYKIYVRPYTPSSPQPWKALDEQFTIKVLQQTSGGSTPQKKNIIQKPDAVDGYYTYYEDLEGSAWRQVSNNVLAKWKTGKGMNGLWQVRILAKDSLNNYYPGAIQICEDGTTRSTVILCLDNDEPEPVTVNITGVQFGGAGSIEPAEACGDFHVGDIIHGTYHVHDKHFKLLTLNVIPNGPAHGAAVSPSIRTYGVVPTTGESGQWSLDTKGMDACGYVIRLWGVDRTIVGSNVQHGLRDHADVGFCLDE